MLRGAVIGVALAVTVIGLAACVTVNEQLTGRDITCDGTPDDVCLRVAELAAAQVPDIEWTALHVRPTACGQIVTVETPTRCWTVTGDSVDAGFEGTVVERPDGAIVIPQ